MIIIGEAIVIDGRLRCTNRRVGKENRTYNCNKLICKANSRGQIAGKFQCGSCKAHVEVLSG
jgi:hypothetical protein